jgi:hypothetical protein
MRDGRRWLSIFYYYSRRVGDYTQSARTISRERVRPIFRKAFGLKRFAADKSRRNPDEALACVKSMRNGDLKTEPKKRNKRRLIHVIGPATATETRKTLAITNAEKRNVLRAFRAAGIKL